MLKYKLKPVHDSDFEISDHEFNVPDALVTTRTMAMKEDV
jgi:hypothetical protein